MHASIRTTAVKPHRCGASEQKVRHHRGNVSRLGTQSVRCGCVWVPSSGEDAERLRSCGAALGTHTQPHRRATGGAELWNISKAERSLALLVWNSLRPSICAAVPVAVGGNFLHPSGEAAQVMCRLCVRCKVTERSEVACTWSSADNRSAWRAGGACASCVAFR